MFAAISNNSKIVSLLLENDADVDFQNSIGRTASQMASFVNSHEAADLIKGHIPKKSLEYYTNINSVVESEPRLPKGECFEQLYELLTKSINYSPVRIIKAIKFASNNVLLENVEKIIRTLDAFVSKSFKQSETGCPNDILSFKLHYYKYIFEYLLTQKKKLEEKNSNNELSETDLNNKLIDISLKRLVTEENVTLVDEENTTKTRVQSYRVFEEKFIRESIRQFAYPEAAIIKQLVTILSKTAIGNYPSALSVLNFFKNINIIRCNII